ncbi:MAG: c-type cytochrome [Pirellulaceae bacterium]|nr:c-type cytochrome [Pirellulaceae bacterium]
MRLLKNLLPVLLAVLASSNSLIAADGDEEEPYLPGLIARYSDSTGNSFRRLDEAIAFDWAGGSPDGRLAADGFQIQWRGNLFAQGAGEYRLAVHAAGEVELKLAGKTVIESQQAAGWVFSQPVTLEFDRHEIEVSFKKTKSPAHVSLYWSGPQFQLEPVPPRFLMHDRKESVSTAYERGELLAAALRCAACHREDADPKPLAAPSLAHLGGNIREDWVRKWLSDKGQEELSVRRRMPAYGFSDDEAAAITAYLLANQPARERPKKEAEPSPPLGQPKSGKTPPVTSPATGPSVDEGATLFFTRGCLACHQVHGLGESGLFGGGNLSKVAGKRPAGFFRDWLADPSKLNPDHRMPSFDLSTRERTAIDRYLASLGEAPKPARQEQPQQGGIEKGRTLVTRHRCASCHALPPDEQLAPAANVKRLRHASDWKKSCASKGAVSQAHLGYSLNLEDQKALQEFYSAQRISGSEAKPSGRLSLIQNNCLACHGREGVESVSTSLPHRLSEKLLGVVELHPGLQPAVPAMTPPSLNSVGDKLQAEALTAAIRRQGPPLRDYLRVHMPRFPLPDDELQRLVNYFIQTDRIPPLPEAATTKPTAAEEAAFSLAGSRLVSTDGFGCTSCHQVGKVIPDKAPLNARGPSLSSLDKRIRKEWYDRFLHNPARIVPRMEMPSVQVPVKGVLDNKIAPQLAALWHVLATPGFEPPEPNPFRMLRFAGGTEREYPKNIFDTVQLRKATYSAPMLTAFSNRHNLLFDLERNRLVGWWIGDGAAQRTRGKSWFWESLGQNLMENQAPEPEFHLLVGGKEAKAFAHDQHFVLPLRIFANKEIGGNRQAFQYALTFRREGEKEPVRLLVTQHLEDWRDPNDAARTGIVRELFITGVPQGGILIFRAIDDNTAIGAKFDQGTYKLDPKNGTEINVSKNEWQDVRRDGLVIANRHDADRFSGGELEQRGINFQIRYSTKLPIDTFESPSVALPRPEATELEVGHGWKATRLPLPEKLLPTAFAFRPNGSLTFSTLTGEVFSAADSQSQGDAKNSVVKLAEGLAAPYGLFAAEDYVDVLTKTSLIRIPFAAKQAKTITFVASGWGHTEDYHDWAVGLLRSERLHYYVGLPCQQDDRFPSEAKYRGSVIQLVPKQPTQDNAHEYSIEVMSTGHRFPMGLALHRDGDLFVTDNQGNYNPFNELNHVRKGAFFGFVNAIDKKNKDYKVPPTTEPAINIPHPWTRSVNGICFLYTPEKLRKETGKDAFGPLEGQLVGCEYDTRRLIRMSLQKIGETYQGCAYPLSREPSSPEKGFLGPIVCAVSPRGELYVGSIRESGWGAGNNVGEIVKIKFEPEKLPCGIAEVKAIKGGFTIDFLKEFDAKKAADVGNYSISSYRRISSPAYGGPDVERRIEKIDSVEVSPDRRRVFVKLPEVRTGGFVYEIQLKNFAPGDAEFFPAEAYFTLHGVP